MRAAVADALRARWFRNALFAMHKLRSLGYKLAIVTSSQLAFVESVLIQHPTLELLRAGSLLHVQASHSRRRPSEISQFRSRPSVSVSTMGGKRQNPRGNGNQDGFLYALVTGLGFTLHLLGCNRR